MTVMLSEKPPVLVREMSESARWQLYEEVKRRLAQEVDVSSAEYEALCREAAARLGL